MAKKKQISAKEKLRRQRQAQDQWEKDNPVEAWRAKNINNYPWFYNSGPFPNI
jgi:hypothetical protein